MLLGPLVLVLFLYKIIERGGGWLTSSDVGFLVVLAGLPIARWIEFRAGDPRTSTGEPATQAHLKKYITVALFVGMAAWVAAKLLRST